MKINIDLKKALLLSCVVFTLLTIISSVLAIINGQDINTHIHLLLRLSITIIGVCSILIFNYFSKWPLIAVIPIHYATVMGFVLFLFFLSGFFIELHPHAYRDIFFNFTPIYIIIAIGVLVRERLIRKKTQVK